MSGWRDRPNPDLCRNEKHPWVPENLTRDREGTVRCRLCIRDRRVRVRRAEREQDPVANGTVEKRRWSGRELVMEFEILGLSKKQAAARLGVTVWALDKALRRSRRGTGTKAR